MPRDSNLLTCFGVLTEDIGLNRLGVGAIRKGGAIWFAFPIVILVGKN